MDPVQSESLEIDAVVVSTDPAGNEGVSTPENDMVLTESAATERLGNSEHLENSTVAENAVLDNHVENVLLDNHDDTLTNVNGGMDQEQEFKEADIHDIQEVIAATGKFWHPWDILKRMLSCHLKKVLSEYPEAKKTSEEQTTLLGETVPSLLKRLDDALDSFIDGPPFTLQRLCEILLGARDIYPKLSKLALALEKNLSVTSTLTISTEEYPPAAVEKPSIAEKGDSESQSNMVENGVKPPTGDGDEIMTEVEDADVDDHMTIDIETFEEIVRSSESNPEPIMRSLTQNAKQQQKAAVGEYELRRNRCSKTVTLFGRKHNSVSPRHHRFTATPKRRRTVVSSASILHLPLLPFPPDQVLVPCELKTLHLYEARYLALLDQSLFKKRKQFVHFVLDPIALSQTSAEVSFAAKYGCLVRIEKVQRVDIGAMVSVRGVGRVKIAQFEQAEPFLIGAVVPLQDNVLDSATDIGSKVCDLAESLQSLNNLEMKLKAPREALLQTQVANCLTWAESVPSWDLDESFIPALPERVSFAALQPITGSSELELINLQKAKLKAMDISNTKERLESSLEFTTNNISRVAAKLAIQSLDIQ